MSHLNPFYILKKGFSLFKSGCTLDKVPRQEPLPFPEPAAKSKTSKLESVKATVNGQLIHFIPLPIEVIHFCNVLQQASGGILFLISE